MRSLFLAPMLFAGAGGVQWLNRNKSQNLFITSKYYVILVRYFVQTFGCRKFSCAATGFLCRRGVGTHFSALRRQSFSPDRGTLLRLPRRPSEALPSPKQSQYSKAEPLCRRSLAIRGKAQGPEHPDVTHSLDNLGSPTLARVTTQRPSSFSSERWRFWKVGTF